MPPNVAAGHHRVTAASVAAEGNHSDITQQAEPSADRAVLSYLSHPISEGSSLTRPWNPRSKPSLLKLGPMLALQMVHATTTR